MSGNVLTTASTITCPHGGRAVLATTNTKAVAGGAPALLKSDIHPVMGCPFTVGTKYSPCAKIKWSAEANRATVNKTGVLVKNSIGKCFNAEGALQGTAAIVNTQIKVSAQ
jgi:hypothetical protein